MKYIEEGMRLQMYLDEETRLVYAGVWKKYADLNDVERCMLSMIQLCDKAGITPLPPLRTKSDIYDIVIGMVN